VKSFRHEVLQLSDVWWKSFVHAYTDSLPKVHIRIINLNDFGVLLSIDGGEVGMYTKIRNDGENIVAGNRKKTKGIYSVFNVCFP